MSNDLFDFMATAALHKKSGSDTRNGSSVLNKPPLFVVDCNFCAKPATATKEMADEYERIQRRAAEDPGTAGDQGEENWATLLRRWLPSYFHVVTKGRILSHHGIASPQVDVLVLSPAYPKHLLNKKLYLAGGVEAAFECKTTLKTRHITAALANASEIRMHLPERKGTPYRELCSPIIYGLLAHSHSWKSTNSTPVENITSSLQSGDLIHTKHPSEMLDLVCIADLAASRIQAYLHRSQPAP